MAETQPTGEQIRFRSAKTGEHNLDTYMESVEKGTRSLYDLIGDLFDDSGVFRVANFEFRFDASTDKLQVRVGNFSNSTSGWSDLTTFFSIEGTFSSSTSYNNFDIVTLSTKDVYIVHGLSSAATYADEAAFISSSNTEKIVDVSEAKDWAIKTDGQVSSTDYSSKAWAIGGTGVTDTASKGAAKEWATKTSGTVDGSNYSSKHWATTGNVATVSSGISNINTVAGAIANVNTVAGVSTSVGLLGTSDAVADMNLLATSANITSMSNLGTSANVTNMANLNASGVITNMANLNASGVITNIASLNASGVIANIGTTAGISSEIATVAGISSAVSNVSGISSAISTVNSNIAKVQATANDLLETTSEIDTVANSIANVDTVGAAISNINTVATNISGVNSFADRYRISSSAPTSSLDVGDLYFDTSANELKVYKTSGWAAAGSTVNGTSQRYTYNISGTPTTVSGSDANGATLGYDAGYADVYLNGVRLSSADITISSGTSVVFASALANGDVVDVVAYGTFNVASIDAGNLSSGSIPNARFPATLPAISGANLTNLDASDLASGTVPIARLGSSGTKDSTTFLRGDNTFAVVDTTNASNLSTGTVNIARLGTSGTKDSTTFLRGDNTFAVVDTTNASNLSTGTLPNARLSSVPNSALANSSITVNGSAIALGGSVTVEVDFTWETKTSAFNASANKGYFVDTTSGAITATLPASPTAGDTMRFIDLSATFDSNNLTVARNGKKIQGDASDMTVATERAGFALVFSGDTQGWLMMEK